MNNVSHYIDHTNLRQDALQREIMDLCEQGINFDFASVCVNPVHVPLVVSILKDERPSTSRSGRVGHGLECWRIKARRGSCH